MARSNAGCRGGWHGTILVSAFTAGSLGVPLALVAAATRQDAPPITTVASCVSDGCHDRYGDRDIVHGPVGQRKCLSCHAWVDPGEHRFELIDATGALCTSCHTVTHRTYVHEPLRTGDCTGCHDPHASDQPHLLRLDPAAALCQSCHQDIADPSRPFVHGPVATGACIVCHDAHSSWRPNLLSEEPRQLCLGCHDEVRPDHDGGRYRHPPFADDCLACHDPHASDAPGHLREPTPDLCFSCHEQTREALRHAPVVHGALAVQGGCLECHAPHTSRLPALRRRNDIASCLTCHDRPIMATDGRELTDMLALLRHNPSHHGPIREGQCTTCHLPHAAEEPRLLPSAYPADLYAPYERERYALCFGCHIADLAESPHGRGLTGFRDDDVNLHWLHVNRDKGRTCRTCHEVHASRNPFHMRDSVPYGREGWALEIGFSPTPAGGSCAPGCHQPETYDRGPDGRPAPATILSNPGASP